MEAKSKFLEVYKNTKAQITLLLNTVAQRVVKEVQSWGKNQNKNANTQTLMTTHFRIFR